MLVAAEKGKNGAGVDAPAPEPSRIAAPFEDNNVTEAPQPPDGGWGWLVAFGCFIATFLVFGQTFSFSILFSHYLMTVGASTATAAWIYNMMILLSLLTAPLVRPLALEFGWRSVSFVGVSLSSLGFFLSAFTPSPYFLFFSFSLLHGVGSGLVNPIAFSITSRYFVKHRGKANTLVVVGPSMAQMVLMPLIRYLHDEYGFRGAALIDSGIVMHVFLGVALFHPLKWHLKHPQQQRQAILFPSSETPMFPETSEPPALPIAADDTSEDHDWATIVAKARLRRQSRGAVSISETSCSSYASIEAAMAEVMVDSGSFCSVYQQEPHGSDQPRTFISRIWLIMTRVAKMAAQDLKIIRNSRSIIICLSICTGTISIFSFFLLMPFAFQYSGLSLQDAATYFMVLGITSLVSRFIMSPLTDCKWYSFRVSMICGYSLRATGIAVMCLGLRDDKLWMRMASSIVLGMGNGTTNGLNALSIIATLGLDNLLPQLSVNNMAMVPCVVSLGPLVGLLRDVTGSYSVCLWVLTGLELCAVTLWLLMPAAAARDRKKFATTKHPSYADTNV